MSEDLTDDEKNAAYTTPITGETETSQEDEVAKSVLVPVEEQIPGINTIGLLPLEQALVTGKSIPDQAIDSMFLSGRQMRDYLDYYEDRGEIPNLKGTVLVDLGTGSFPFSYYLAQLGGATGFVAVEPYNFWELESNFKSDKYGWEKSVAVAKREKEGIAQTGELPASIVTEDMLTFLRRLPDHSVSLHVAGIDEAILPNANYREQVKNEMKRVLSPDGVFIEGENAYCLTPKGLTTNTDSVTVQGTDRRPERTASIYYHTLPKNEE